LTRRPLDQELVSRSLAADLSEARNAIDEGRVLVDGSFASKPNTKVAPENQLRILDRSRRYVSRGGAKLEGALEDLSVSVVGARCLDGGAGTGGFTDCLLEHGASEVRAVDVGYGQIDWKLRSDPRVHVVERTNIRTASPEILGGPYDLVVADLSFISLELVIDKLAGLISSDGALLLLVKPQFEAPAADVGEGGVVTNPSVWTQTLRRVAKAIENAGVVVKGVSPSRLKGAEGNQEFFALASRGTVNEIEDMIERAVSSVTS
jgi:23S rRNA (cytidine1920-2'-O)/16S rRNA (cytidine1409-2'-O)-methyltransferase